MTDRLALGASYQSRLYMVEFEDYEGLFAEEGDFDAPPMVTAGLSFKVPLLPSLRQADAGRAFRSWVVAGLITAAKAQGQL